MGAPTTEFTAKQTDIPGLLIFRVTSIDDERGYFQEKFQKAKLVAAGLPTDFNIVQINVSYNKKAGVVRGLHAEPWDKYISVTGGKVFAAYVDLRKGSSFGKIATVEIDHQTAVYLPKGVANSYQTLTDDTYYVYGVNDHWSQELYDKYTFTNINDPNLNINWPIPLEQSVLSDRDRQHPMLKDVKPMEL